VPCLVNLFRTDLDIQVGPQALYTAIGRGSSTALVQKLDEIEHRTLLLRRPIA
jgi:hypothetical protein